MAEEALGDCKRIKRKSHVTVLPLLFTLVILLNYSSRTAFTQPQPISTTNNTQPIGGRHLLAEEECVSPAINEFPNDFLNQAQRLQGGVVFHILFSFFMCYSLAIVCDDYFVPSLAGISEALNLPSDVAGATFMAAGTSAPELFTSVIGAFITEGDIGVGTIVGSAVFNILAVVSVCGLLAGASVPLEWWPLTRDCLYYVFSVLALLLVMTNAQIHWYEAVILLIMFFIYIFIMYFNTRLERLANALLFKCCSKSSDNSEEKTPLLPEIHRVRTYSSVSSSSEQGIHQRRNSDPERGRSGSVTKPRQPKVEFEKKNEEEKEPSGNPPDKKECSLRETLEGSNDEADGSIFSMPYYNPWQQVAWVLMWPANLLFNITIPDCRTDRWRNWYMLTFLISITYIGALSYLLSWMVTIIGYTFGIPDTVMGLTFLAAGTSVPEAISSVIVCRQGFGNMAISNSVGSNIFDILFCLGLPWLIKALTSPENGYAVQINSKGLEYSIIALFVTVVLMFGTVAINRFYLNKRVGVTCLLIYGAFLVISSLFELNVFGQVNLPTCIQ